MELQAPQCWLQLHSCYAICTGLVVSTVAASGFWYKQSLKSATSPAQPGPQPGGRQLHEAGRHCKSDAVIFAHSQLRANGEKDIDDIRTLMEEVDMRIAGGQHSLAAVCSI